MLKKNKKKRVKIFLFSSFYLIIAVILLGSILGVKTNVYASAYIWGDWGDTPEQQATGCGVFGIPKADFGCKCNYDYPFTDPADGKTVVSHITCKEKSDIADISSSALICSTNEYNTSGAQVCLIRMDNPCKEEYACEAGAKCDIQSGKCKIDTGVPPSGLGTEVTDIRDTIRTFINIALGFLGVLCVVFIIYGGVLWLTSSGKSDQVKKGQDTMIWAALGAIIITIAWTITSYVLHIGEVVG